MIDPMNPQRDPVAWSAMTLEQRAQIVQSWTDEWAVDYSRGTVRPGGAIRDGTPPMTDMFVDWQVAIGERLSDTYGVAIADETADDGPPRPWRRLDAAGQEWFASWRDGVQRAHAAASAEHAAIAEAARIEHERAHPEITYVPGSLDPLSGTPVEARITLDDHMARLRADQTRRQLAAAEERRRLEEVRAREGYVAGAIRPAPGISAAARLEQLEHDRQERLAAQAAERDRLFQGRIASGRAPGAI